MSKCEHIPCSNDTKSKKRFCSRDCMYKWRKSKSHIKSICKNETCNKEFEHRKKDPRMFCSDKCMRSSSYIKKKRSQQLLDSNPMDNPAVRKKHLVTVQSTEYRERQRILSSGRPHTDKTKKLQSEIKLKHYVTNKDDIIQKRELTYLEKYGISLYDHLRKINAEYCADQGIINSFQLPHAIQNSKKRISKGQRLLFEQTKKQYPDSKLEYFLDDIKRSVDIFIPSQNKVIEYYGDYWHCNPSKYSAEFYHDLIKCTADDIWKRDKIRETQILNAGYELEIIWET